MHTETHNTFTRKQTHTSKSTQPLNLLRSAALPILALEILVSERTARVMAHKLVIPAAVLCTHTENDMHTTTSRRILVRKTQRTCVRAHDYRRPNGVNGNERRSSHCVPIFVFKMCVCSAISYAHAFPLEDSVCAFVSVFVV